MRQFLASNGVTIIDTGPTVTFRHPGDLWTGVHLSGKTITALREYFTAGVLERQLEWDGLTETEAIEELRRGDESPFYPLFSADPKIFADCPRDGRVVVDASGICDHCLYDFTEQP